MAQGRTQHAASDATDANATNFPPRPDPSVEARVGEGREAGRFGELCESRECVSKTGRLSGVGRRRHLLANR